MNGETLLRRLKGIRDAAIRRQLVLAGLANGDPESWVRAIRGLCLDALIRNREEAILGLLSVADALADPSLGYDTRKGLYEAAAGQGLPAVGRLFFETPVPPADARAERAVVPRGRILTLGERKSLARTHDRSLIEAVARDPHPAVVAIALGNPHLIEGDVVKMAAVRPGQSQVLVEIARHAGWMARHPVRRALVQNPATPLDLAFRLTPTLLLGEVRAVAGDGALAAALNAHAAELVAMTRDNPAEN